jgi:hypothetical protein
MGLVKQKKAHKHLPTLGIIPIIFRDRNNTKKYPSYLCSFFKFEKKDMKIL